MNNDPCYPRILFDQLSILHLNRLSEIVCKEDNWWRRTPQESNRAYSLSDLEEEYQVILLDLEGLFDEI